MTIPLSLEVQVLQALLSGEDDVLAVLRKQLERIEVSSRKMTGVGFYSDFIVNPTVPRLLNFCNFKLGDVNGTAKNLRNGLGFVLHVTNGTLYQLEGYTYDEPWPNEIDELRLSYSSGEVRNMEKLRELIRGSKD